MKTLSIKARVAVTLSAFAIAMLVPVVGTQQASATVPCQVYPGSKKFVVNDDKTITGTFKVDGDANCTAGATVMVWNADPSLHPKPEFWTTQTVHDQKSGTYAKGEHSLTVKLPVCATDPNVVSGYQADVIAHANPPHVLTPPGAGGFWDSRQAHGGYLVLDVKVAGDKCPAPKPVEEKPPVVETPVKETPAPAKETPVEVTPVAAPAPETLVETGPAGMLAVAGIVGTASAIGHNLVMRRRSQNV